jgi:hypothetical protein
LPRIVEANGGDRDRQIAVIEALGEEITGAPPEITRERDVGFCSKLEGYRLETLRCSYDTARRDFLSEEGVLERSNSGDRKRLYRQILIPESVLLRVLRRREKKPVPQRSAA